MKRPTIKLEDSSLQMAIASSVASLEHSQPSSRPSQSQSIAPPKKSGEIISNHPTFSNLFL